MNRDSLSSLFSQLPLVASLALLSACGGGGDGGASILGSAADVESTYADASHASSTSWPTANQADPSKPVVPVDPSNAGTTFSPPPDPMPPKATPPLGTLAIKSIEVAQTHVIPPNGLALPKSPEDAAAGRQRSLYLVENRATLLMVEPSTTLTTGELKVRALLGATILGEKGLNPPSQLPSTDGGRAPYSVSKYSTLMPNEWLKQGVRLVVSHTGSSNTIEQALTVMPDLPLSMHMIPIFLVGSKAAGSPYSYDMSTHSIAGYPADAEYAQRLPVSSFKPILAGAVEMTPTVTPPRNDDTFCATAQALSSNEEWDAAFYDNLPPGGQRWAKTDLLSGIAFDWRSATANRNGDQPEGTYSQAQFLTNGNQLGKDLYGLGGGRGGVNMGDNTHPIYGAYFLHEMGHAFGLPHADESNSPYGGTVGKTWGYDAVKNQLLSPVQIAGGCSSSQISDSTCYKRTPMSGGDYDRYASVYRFGMFSDYQAAIMQSELYNSYLPDTASEGGFRRWDQANRKFDPLTPSLLNWIGRGNVRSNQPTISIVGSVSHFNVTPRASRTFVSAPGMGNIPKNYDPTSASDMALLQSITNSDGSGSFFCRSSGCDYTMEVTYSDGTTMRALLSLGYHKENSATELRDGVKDPLHWASFGRYVVNIPARSGGVRQVDIYETPMGLVKGKPLTVMTLASLRGSRLVNQWRRYDDGSIVNAGGTGPGVIPLAASCKNASAKQLLPVAVSCQPAWSAGQAYVAGTFASDAGVNYRANWWTQGQSPSSNSGPTGSGQPWTAVGNCSGGTPTSPSSSDRCQAAWSASQGYVEGNIASYGGANYRANWWVQNENPASNSGPPGSGRPWTMLGICS